MLTTDQLKEFKGKLLTKMLQIADEIAFKESFGLCLDDLECQYNYLSLMKDAIFMKDNGLSPSQTETLVYRVTSRARLNEIYPISFILLSDVLFGDTISNELLMLEITKIKGDVANIYNILNGVGGGTGGSSIGITGLDGGNAATNYIL